jgi:hypothetical protein
MAASLLVLLPIMTMTVVPIHAAPTVCTEQRHQSPEVQAVSEFTANVALYLEVHRLLASPLSSLSRWADPEQTLQLREAHRKAIVDAHIATPRGDVFTPRVAAYMRHQILNAAYSATMSGDDVQLAAIEKLPRLPLVLEYRFVDRDLVLLDKEIDQVVDVLDEALPPEAAMEWTEMCSGS